jgi:tetratricopeptide (TPR) repeat protein
MVGAALYPWRPSTRSVTSHYTASEEAQRLYEQGVNYLRKPTQRGIDSAIDHLGKAIEHDPLFAVAHVKLANSLILKSVEIGPDPLMRRAKDLVDHAIEIDDMLAEGYALRGFIAWIHDLDLAAAERALDSAIGLDADSAEAHYTLARVLADTGRFLDALSHARQAAKNEPLSPYNRKRVPYVLYLEGRYNDAINAYLDLIALDSDFIQTQRELGLVYQEKRMFKEALAQFQRVQAMPSNYSPTMTRADIAQLHAVAGNHNEAERMLDALLEQAKSAFVSPYDIAVIYAGLGRQDAALNWLESAVIVRPFWLSLIKVDPRLESLRAGPRYAGMIQKLRL